MARSLGDIVRMPLPTCTGPQCDPPLNLVPGVPSNLQAAFTTRPVSVETNQPAQLLPSSDVLQSLYRPPGTAMPYPSEPSAYGGSHPQKNGPWARTPILPDSILPPALKRIQSFTETTYRPNPWDGVLRKESQFWKWTAEHGG